MKIIVEKLLQSCQKTFIASTKLPCLGERVFPLLDRVNKRLKYGFVDFGVFFRYRVLDYLLDLDKNDGVPFESFDKSE